jgi:hypothetical protein
VVHHEEIRKARGRRPFQPFVLHVADGRSFKIGHPELVFVTTNGRTVVFEDKDGHVELIDSLLVTSVSTAGEPEPPRP